MNLARLFSATLVGGLSLLVNTPPLAANPIVREINIRPIISPHNRYGNAEGLALNTNAQVMYLSQANGSENGGFLYTLNMNGALIAELDWDAFYGPNSWPKGLAYDATTGRLHVQVIRHDGTFTTFSTRVVEIDPTGPTILGEFPSSTSSRGFERRADGYWQTINGQDILRHSSLGGTIIEDIPLAGFGAGTHPDGVATSFTADGFFLSDHFGRQIVEVDRQGNLVRAASTGFLPIGGCWAFESDPATRLLYVQAGNMVIYVLNEEVMELPTLLDQATWGSLKARYR